MVDRTDKPEVNGGAISRQSPRLGRHPKLIAAAALAALMFIAQAASAGVCFGDEGAWFARTSAQYVYKGIKGSQYIPVANNNPSNVLAAHSAQVSGQSPDFIALGTAGGAASSASCVADTNATWQVFIDGKAFGTYFCTAIGQEPAGATASFEVSYGFCPLTPAGNKWLFYWRGSLMACKTVNVTAGDALAVMIEDRLTGAPDLNLDYGYRTVKYKTSGGWLVWGNNNSSCADPNYLVSQYPESNADLYLAPWGS